jgi:hypothetical protein
MRATLVLAILLSLGALPAEAADAGGEFVVTSSPPEVAYPPDAAMSPQGEALAVWGDDFDVEGRRFGRDGQPLGDDFQVGETYQNYLGPLSGAVDPLGFSVVWSDFGNHSPGNGFFRRFGPAGQPLTDQLSLGQGVGPTGVGTDRNGNSVVVAVDPSSLAVVGWRFDAAGRRIGRFRVAGRGAFPQVAVDARGRFTVLWFNEDGIFARRFDAAAKPAGPVLQIAERGSAPRLAGNAGGSFVAVWKSVPGVIQARVYAPDGPRRTATVTSRPEASTESVAMDASGRFLVTWSCCQEQAPRLFGRFFEASGQPLDRPFQVSLGSGTLDYQSSAAAGPAGRFLVVWLRTYVEGGRDLIGRYLAWARAGDDLCRLGPAGLACDVAHDGTTGLVTPALPVPAQLGTPFLGDLDGDRRDDLCVYASGRFRCDTGHDGAAEVDISFGAGGIPLLGDLDGDGRDDPCSRQGTQVLCDTGHNGGAAEVVVNFGALTSPVFLLNEDGDRDDDVCALSEDGFLLCDTGDDGGAAESRIRYPTRAGDVPLFGDVDDDGRDDPCVARGGRLLCDADHNGNFERSYPFSLRAGEFPLLGDVNGI